MISSPRDWIVLALAVLLMVAALYASLPAIVPWVFRIALAVRYSFRVKGREHVPRKGAALLAANHLSWLDGFILAGIAPRQGKALVSAGIVANPVLKPIAIRSGLIPTPFAGPRAIRAAISEGRASLDRGECLGIFPEGQISRTGLLGPFYRGLEVILKGHDDVPVIPVAIDNVWGSIFSRAGGKFFARRPRGLRRTINVVFGPPVPPPVTIFPLRQALLEAMVHAYAMRPEPGPPPDTIDFALPHWRHPGLGLLTASTADIHLDDVHQLGQKEGSVGHSVPGVAIRVVGDDGLPLPPQTEGRLEALVAGRDGWQETGCRGSMDPDGFVRMSDPAAGGTHSARAVAEQT